MDFKRRINKAFDDVDKILQDGTSLPSKIRVALRHALENLATACTAYDDYDRGYLSNSRKLIKSGYKEADWEALFYALRAAANRVTEEIAFNTDEECKEFGHKCAEDIMGMAKECQNHQAPINSSRKSIKSSWFKPEDIIAYLVGGDKDTITIADEDEAAAYDVYYYGYGIMDDGEKGHMFIGKYDDVKEFVENYLGLGWTDEFAYPYILSGTEITKYFQNLPSKPLPTEKDYRDFVNQLNKYVAENYETHGNYGPIYVFDMYKGEGTNSDGYGHEYPNFIIYDDEGNLDMHSDDDITEYIRNELKAKGWYPEAVHSSSDFTIAVM